MVFSKLLKMIVTIFYVIYLFVISDADEQEVSGSVHQHNVDVFPGQHRVRVDWPNL